MGGEIGNMEKKRKTSGQAKNGAPVKYDTKINAGPSKINQYSWGSQIGKRTSGEGTH